MSELKPSARIQQIWGNAGPMPPVVEAVVQYLDEQHAQREATEAAGFAHCGHGYASDSPHCVQCHPTTENIVYLVNQYAAQGEDLQAMAAALEAEQAAHRQTQAKLEAIVAELGESGWLNDGEGVVESVTALGEARNDLARKLDGQTRSNPTCEITEGKCCECSGFRRVVTVSEAEWRTFRGGSPTERQPIWQWHPDYPTPSAVFYFGEYGLGWMWKPRHVEPAPAPPGAAK